MLNNFILPFQTKDDGGLIPSVKKENISSSSVNTSSPDISKTKTTTVYKPYTRPSIAYDILGKPHLDPLEPYNPLEGIEYQYGKKRIYGPSTNKYNSMNCGIRKDIIIKIINNNGTVFTINGNYFLIVRDTFNLPLIEKFSNRTWQTYNGLARGCETDTSNIMFCACPIKKGDNNILQIGQIYTLVKDNSAVDIIVSQVFTNFNSQKIKHYWGYISRL